MTGLVTLPKSAEPGGTLATSIKSLGEDVGAINATAHKIATERALAAVWASGVRRGRIRYHRESAGKLTKTESADKQDRRRAERRRARSEDLPTLTTIYVPVRRRISPDLGPALRDVFANANAWWKAKDDAGTPLIEFVASYASAPRRVQRAPRVRTPRRARRTTRARRSRIAPADGPEPPPSSVERSRQSSSLRGAAS